MPRRRRASIGTTDSCAAERVERREPVARDGAAAKSHLEIRELPYLDLRIQRMGGEQIRNALLRGVEHLYVRLEVDE